MVTKSCQDVNQPGCPETDKIRLLPHFPTLSLDYTHVVTDVTLRYYSEQCVTRFQGQKAAPSRSSFLLVLLVYLTCGCAVIWPPLQLTSMLTYLNKMVCLFHGFAYSNSYSPVAVTPLWSVNSMSEKERDSASFEWNVK